MRRLTNLSQAMNELTGSGLIDRIHKTVETIWPPPTPKDGEFIRIHEAELKSALKLAAMLKGWPADVPVPRELLFFTIGFLVEEAYVLGTQVRHLQTRIDELETDLSSKTQLHKVRVEQAS